MLVLSPMLPSCAPDPRPSAPASGLLSESAAPPAASPQASTSRPTEPRIPAAFQGEWNSDPSACGSGLHDSRLVISETNLRFYESSGLVTAARSSRPEQLEVEVALSGEGEAWTERRTFRLSPDGATLVDVTNAQPLVRRRCPVRR